MAQDSRFNDLCAAVHFLAEAVTELSVAFGPDSAASEQVVAARRMAEEAERTLERMMLVDEAPTSKFFSTLSKRR